jgi:putative Mn2+ efflux pump MntP
VSFAAIVILSVGLAMDAAAVAAARGLAAKHVAPRHALLVALYFGGSQALMPLIGWLVGSRIGPLVAAWDHWIAFVLLVGLGAKMLMEARETKRVDPAADLFGPRVMIVLAIATSIDALAAGFTLPMIDAPPLLAIVTIGVTTALLSVIALYAGRRFGAALGPRLDVLGGLVLIALGVKVLVEHLGA